MNHTSYVQPDFCLRHCSNYRLPMRFRVLVPVLALVVVACSGPSRPASAVPDIPTTLATLPVPPAACSISLDLGRGARIRTTSGSSANVLLPNDVIVSVGDVAVYSSGSLLAAVAAQTAGSTVGVTVVRSGEEQTVPVTLGATADGDPRLGVIVVTEQETISLSAAPTTEISGRYIRALSMEGQVYLLDAATAAWQATGLEVSQQEIWFASAGDLYRLEVTPDQNELLSVSLTGGETVTLDLQERRVLTVAGTFSGAIMLVFATEDGNSLVAFDPATGSQLWELPIGGTGGRTIAFTNPIRASVALVASADPETLVGTVEIVDTDGAPTGSVVTPADADGGRLLGWYDEATLLFSDADDNRRIVTLSLETRETTTLQLPSLAGLTRLQPLGDGRHLIIQVDGDLARIEASEDGEAISLTHGCEIGVLTDFGWS